MTAMPDLIAKTRIFHALDHLFNSASTAELVAMQTELLSRDIGDVIDDLISTGRLNMSSDDFDHIMEHVFGRSGPASQWWETRAEDIFREGIAQLIQHVAYDDPFGSARERNVPRKVNSLWLCPVTYYFRTIVITNPYVPNPDWLTFMLVTPPKEDHKIHYREYKRRTKKKEKHDEMPDIYDEPENIWVTSLYDDTVKKGKKKSNGADIDIAIPIPSITSLAGIETVQLLAERY